MKKAAPIYTRLRETQGAVNPRAYVVYFSPATDLDEKKFLSRLRKVANDSFESKPLISSLNVARHAPGTCIRGGKR